MITIVWLCSLRSVRGAVSIVSSRVDVSGRSVGVAAGLVMPPGAIAGYVWKEDSPDLNAIGRYLEKHGNIISHPSAAILIVPPEALGD